jgi:hypothetical protein
MVKMVVAGTNKGVYRSANSGTSWNAVDSGLSSNLPIIYSLAVSGANLFAGTSAEGVFLSKDNGLTWTIDNRQAALKT